MRGSATTKKKTAVDERESPGSRKGKLPAIKSREFRHQEEGNGQRIRGGRESLVVPYPIRHNLKRNNLHKSQKLQRKLRRGMGTSTVTGGTRQERKQRGSGTQKKKNIKRRQKEVLG